MSDQPKRTIKDFEIGSEWMLLGKKVVVTNKAESLVDFGGTWHKPFVAVAWWAGDLLQEKTLYCGQIELLQPVQTEMYAKMMSKEEFEKHYPKNAGSIANPKDNR